MGLKTDQGAVNIEEYGFNHCVVVYNNIIIAVAGLEELSFVAVDRPTKIRK